MRLRLLPLILCLPALLSCSSPPKPPTVEPSQRHQVNTGMAVDLQVCRNELHNTRILATESGRLADTRSATLNNLIAQQRMLAVLRDAGSAPTGGNSVYTIRFDYGSSQVDVPAQAATTLIAQARTAPLILLRGRTDGIADSVAESRVARERADAVRDYLVTNGVDPGRIRATYQPAGDPVADNSSATGRKLNRRVEIEIYRAIPVALNESSATP